MSLIGFLDESGDHSLRHIDPASPWFILGIAVCEVSNYFSVVIPALNKLKAAYWDHEGVIFHGYEIRKGSGDFRCLHTKELKDKFHQEIADFLLEMPFKLFACAIDKTKLHYNYGDSKHPYFTAMTFLIERLYLEYKEQGISRFPVVAESRGHVEDTELMAAFYKTVTDGSGFISGKYLQRTGFTMEMAKKSTNIAGLQIVDLALSPILSHLRNPNSSNKPYDIIKSKIRREPNSTWDFKVFP